MIGDFVIEFPKPTRDLCKAESTPVLTRLCEVQPVAPWVPFPVEVLPEAFREFVLEGSHALGCDPSMIAVPLLVGAAGSVGNARRIRLKKGWTEPCVLWGAVIAESGSLKSPAMELAIRPVQQVQDRAYLAHESAMNDHKILRQQWETDLDRWKRKGRGQGEVRPPEPIAPICERFVCQDVTVEALADRLSDARRGLLLATDELAGWLGSFNSYKKSGNDVPHWLSMHRANSLTVDRKTTAKKLIHIPRAAVSVIGTVQPQTLRRGLGRVLFENGLAARLLLAMPPPKVKRWTDASMGVEVSKRVSEVFEQLLGLQMDQLPSGEFEPVTLALTPAALAEWKAFYNEHAKLQNSATGDEAAMLSKIEGAAARIALVVQLVKNSGSLEIDAESIRAGVMIVRWFAHEAERIYSVFGEAPDDRERRELIELVRRKGGRITPRELMRASRRFRGSEQAEQALNGLGASGFGEWLDEQPGPHGGRPTRSFGLFTSGDGDTTQETPEECEVLSPSPQTESDLEDSGDLERRAIMELEGEPVDEP